MKKLFVLFIFVLLFGAVSTRSVFAHPGPVDAEGCHECRRGCDFWNYWSVPNVLKHCHPERAFATSTVTKEKGADYSLLWSAGAEVKQILGGNSFLVQFEDGSKREVRLIGAESPSVFVSEDRAECIEKKELDATEALRGLV